MQATRTKYYFKDGNVVAQSGDVCVYDMDNQFYLEIKGDLWALESEYSVYMEQLKDLPYGNCLEIGLGLGIASRCIMTFPKVKHLTTIEQNKDVINIHNDLKPYLDTRLNKWMLYDIFKHTIINKSGLNYLLECKEKYDFIFLDFYRAIDEDTLPLIKDMVNIAKKVLTKDGVVCGWLDPYTPVEHYEEFENIFR